MVLKNKRGVIEDLKFVFITLFTFILVFMIAFVSWNEYVDAINDIGEDIISNDTKSDIADMGRVFTFMDTLIPFLFLSLWGSVIFFSISTVPEHPFFFIISFGSLLLVTLLMVVLTDVGIQYADNAIFDTIEDSVSNSLFFINNFHYISFGVMLITLVLFYSRNKQALNRGVV